MSHRVTADPAGTDPLFDDLTNADYLVDDGEANDAVGAIAFGHPSVVIQGTQGYWIAGGMAFGGPALAGLADEAYSAIGGVTFGSLTLAGLAAEAYEAAGGIVFGAPALAALASEVGVAIAARRHGGLPLAAARVAGRAPTRRPRPARAKGGVAISRLSLAGAVSVNDDELALYVLEAA